MMIAVGNFVPHSDILEMTLNNLNALPGVQAKGILEPGDKIGSSSLTIVLGASPIVEGAVYTDNYGGKYSGRYRYGMQVIVNEPLRSGEISSHFVQNISR